MTRLKFVGLLYYFDIFACRKLHVLNTPETDALNLVVNIPTNMLLAGCENLCYGWKIDNLKKVSRSEKD